MNKKIKSLTLCLLSLQLASCGKIIDSGKRGVEVSFGKVKEEALKEGFYFYNPFSTSIHEIDIRTKKISILTQTYTKDVQTTSIEYTINANIISDEVTKLYTSVGIGRKGLDDTDFKSKILTPVSEGILKSVVGNWTATDLIANRDKASKQIFERLKVSLADKGVNLTDFQITNINYAHEFERAVELKVKAIQEAEQAKNTTVRIREEAQQKIISSKAEAESMRIRSNALAQNKSLVEYEAVQKWDGRLPQYMLGNSIPFINLNK